MFLYQKLNYDYKHLEINNKEQFKEEIDSFISGILKDNPEYICFDTETDGLNIITSKPFLVAIGYNKVVRTFDFDKDLLNYIWESLVNSGIIKRDSFIGLAAHNCKFDYHIVENGGAKIPIEMPLFDSITVARLTEYADNEESVSLEKLGEKYVDPTAKFASGVIKKIINQLNKDYRDNLRKEIVKAFPNDEYETTTKTGKTKYTAKMSKLISDYEKNRVQYLNDDEPMYQFIDKYYKRASYKDVYGVKPNLMQSYAADDIVIMLEYLKRSILILKQVDKDFRVLKREGELIRVAAQMEKVGLKIDIDYMLECRKNIVEYRELMYNELHEMVGINFTVGQHDLIKKILLDKYSVKTEKCDVKALKYIQKNGKGQVVDFVTNIIELRTVDKWLSTYIDGKLNVIVNGRIHTDMNNNGAVSGRISCDMQQQPKDPLYHHKKVVILNNMVDLGLIEEFSDAYYDELRSCELFHPRQMFITDEGYSMFFLDMSQMELRIQAYMTMITASEPDTNLCRAYIPYKCQNENKLSFDYKDIKHLKEFKEYKWYKLEDNEMWTPTDLHSQTTHHAFPNVPIGSKEFKHLRKKGKMTNFLKVYQGGIGALMEQLDCDREMAESLDSAFYKAFPRIRDYQEWVNKQANLYGYVENLYGRRYYMKNSKWFYKLCNYLIQGTCADMMKTIEINIANYLKGNNLKSKMVLPIHDEIIFLIANGEEQIVGDLKAMMQDTYDIIKYMPMIAEVEYSKTNWRDKEEYKKKEIN